MRSESTEYTTHFDGSLGTAVRFALSVRDRFHVRRFQTTSPL